MSAPDRLAFGRPLQATPLPLCPELSLWLLAAEIDLEAECRSLRDCDPPPFWAFCWGSGQALARYVLDHPDCVRGRRVADFGAGGGVAAIAAARAGAAAVLAVDSDADAREVCLANAAHNGARIEVAAALPDDWDVLLASDVLYEPGNAEWLRGLRGAGRTLLLSDPERASSPNWPGEVLARYTVTTLPDVDSPQRSAVVFGG